MIQVNGQRIIRGDDRCKKSNKDKQQNNRKGIIKALLF